MPEPIVIMAMLVEGLTKQGIAPEAAPPVSDTSSGCIVIQYNVQPAILLATWCFYIPFGHAPLMLADRAKTYGIVYAWCVPLRVPTCAAGVNTQTQQAMAAWNQSKFPTARQGGTWWSGRTLTFATFASTALGVNITGLLNLHGCSRSHPQCQCMTSYLIDVAQAQLPAVKTCVQTHHDCPHHISLTA